MTDYTSILLVLLVSPLLTEGVSVYCELKWVYEGYGNIPANSIEGGSKEYIGRAYHNNEWIPGRISTLKGKIYITSKGRAIEYSTYQVLTNPNNCLLEWVNGYSNAQPPADSVSVNPLADPKVFIGRGVIAGLVLGGKVVIEESAIFISHEGREVMRISYQILRSFYPSLKVRLSRFRFTIDLNGKNTTELIGQEDIRNSFNSEILQHINHGKTIQERFTLTEERNWEGFSSVEFSFPLWYGSSDVTGKFQLNPVEPEDVELTIYRDREVSLQRDLTIKGASGNSANHIQVCSTVNIVEDLDAPIPFTALVTYEAENMTGEQVKIILEALKRPMSTKVTKRNSVSGEIKGALNGRFALHMSSHTNIMNPLGICYGYATI